MELFKIKMNLSSFQKRKKDDPDVATGLNFGVSLFLLVGSKSICNPKMNITRIGGPPKSRASFQR